MCLNHVNGNNTRYFDTIGVEHIPKELKKISTNKNIIISIDRIQAYNLTMVMVLNWIYLFYVKKQNFIRIYKSI